MSLVRWVLLNALAAMVVLGWKSRACDAAKMEEKEEKKSKKTYGNREKPALAERMEEQQETLAWSDLLFSSWRDIAPMYSAVNETVIRFPNGSKPCVDNSTLTYAANGKLSFTESLIRCLQFINDPLLFPGYSAPPSDLPMTVYSQVALNNLIMVSEVDNSVSLDIYLRLYWNDPRLFMPDLWAAVSSQENPANLQNGIDISQFLGVQDIHNQTVPGLWLPDIFFPEAYTAEETAFLLRLHPTFVEWSRHIVLTLVQSNFEYKSYPLDEQFIMLRYYSYGLNITYLQQQAYDDQPIIYYDNYANQDSFKSNPIWTSEGFYTEIVNQVNSGKIVRSTVLDYIYIQRQPSGTVIRLALPIMLLVVLGAMTFWADIQTRSDTTITLLLAVSALYIVIFQSVPMIGYLTVFDKFVISMFIMLFVCSIVHSLLVRLDLLRDQRPTRDLIIRIIEAMFRIFLLPVIVLVYLFLFAPVYSLEVIVVSGVAIFCFFCFILFREYMVLSSVKKKFFEKLNQNVDSIQNSTDLERLIFNIFYFGDFSSSVEIYNRARHGSPDLRSQPTANPLTRKNTDDGTGFLEMGRMSGDKSVRSKVKVPGAVSLALPPEADSDGAIDPSTSPSKASRIPRGNAGIDSDDES